MVSNVSYADWIAIDWGTSNMRAWAIRNGSVVAEASSEKGMGRLRPDEFETALLEVISPWLGTKPVTIVACGMVGARQGWQEAEYLSVPCPPVGGVVCRPKTRDHRLKVSILPGLSQKTPPDVMRGEETQIAGFLASQPEFDGVLCMPGTHTKWVQISAGEVVSFKTFMTGELFELLSKQSVLSHSIDMAWNDAAFAEAVLDGMANPHMFAGRMFGLRAASLLTDPTPGEARARLSGFLIGAELAAAKPYWLGQNIALVGAKKLSALYKTALDAEGASPKITDVTQATLAGLTKAFSALKE